MAKIRGAPATETQALQALARLHLALTHAVSRLEILEDYDTALCERTAPLLLQHRTHLQKIDEMADLFESMADSEKSFTQWINEIIETAAAPEAGLERNAEEAVKTSERRVIRAIDDTIPLTWTDPVRDTMEHMKADTALAQEEVGLSL